MDGADVRLLTPSPGSAEPWPQRPTDAAAYDPSAGSTCRKRWLDCPTVSRVPGTHEGDPSGSRDSVLAHLPCGEPPARHRYAVERDGQGEGEAGEEAGSLCLPGRQRTGRAGHDHEPFARQLHPELPVLRPTAGGVAAHSRDLPNVRVHPQVT